MSSVWPDLFVTENNVTQCVHEIRQALGAKAQQILRTRPRHGYLITAAVVAIPSAKDIEIGTVTRDHPIATLQQETGFASNEGTSDHGILRLSAAPRLIEGGEPDHPIGRVARPEALLKVIASRDLRSPDRDVHAPAGRSRGKVEAGAAYLTTNAPGKDFRFGALRPPGRPASKRPNRWAPTAMTVTP